MKKNNVYKNMTLNIMRTMLSIAFPLISYPYATRVLQVENYGKVSFSQSIVSYISLIAALGISTYAIREGGIYRNNKRQLERFCGEIFAINIFSTIFAYIILIIFLLFSPTLQKNLLLILVFSLTVMLTTLSVDWINIIFEDYIFITLRSFLIQCISLFLLFIIVKTKDDYYNYAFLQVVNVGLIAISNFFHVRKLCRIRFTYKLNLNRHIKSIMILFSNSLAVSIYLNIDNVLLGFMKGDCHVGLYSVSVKIYSILKQLVAAIYNVTITRMTDYLTLGRTDEYKKLLNNVVNKIIFGAIPITAGIVCTSEEIIRVVAGEEYIGATTSLKILALAILFAVLGGALASCVNLPNKEEIKNLKGTIWSAIINLFLNFIAIPIIGIEGAAITTLIAEIFVCFYLWATMGELKEFFDIRSMKENIAKSILGILPIFIFRIIFVNILNFKGIFYLGGMAVLSVLTYVSIELILKNSNMIVIVNKIKDKG